MDRKKERKILIIDDEPYIRQLLADVLDSYGYGVITAAGSLEGLMKAKSEQPDLIVSDINMPEMDGFELLRRLQTDQTTKHIPLIFLTAKSLVQDKVRGLREGALDYICKPFSNDELLARIDLRLQTHQSFEVLSDEKDTEVSGSLFVFSIVDLVQLIGMKGLTGSLEISLENEKDTIVTFNKGNIASVNCGNKSGLNAFRILMEQKDGLFRFSVSEQNFTQEIHMPTSELIFEATRQLDECNRLQESLPDFKTTLSIAKNGGSQSGLPDTEKKILTCFEQPRNIEEALECSSSDELQTLQVIKKLFTQSFLVPSKTPDISPDEIKKDEFEQTRFQQKKEQVEGQIRAYEKKKEKQCHIIVLSVIEEAVVAFVNRIAENFEDAVKATMLHESGSKYKKIQFDRSTSIFIHYAIGYQQFTNLMKELQTIIDGVIVFVETRQTIEQLHFKKFISKLSHEYKIANQICTVGRTYRRDCVEDLLLNELLSSSADILYCNLQEKKEALELLSSFLDKI